MSQYPERDHGYEKIGDGSPADVTGPPIVLEEFKEPGVVCPHCRCEKLFLIKVELAEQSRPSLLRVPEGYTAVGLYTGCPACPWASPMVTSASKKESS